VVIGKRERAGALAVSREGPLEPIDIAIAVGERVLKRATMTNWRIAFRG